MSGQGQNMLNLNYIRRFRFDYYLIKCEKVDFIIKIVKSFILLAEQLGKKCVVQIANL